MVAGLKAGEEAWASNLEIEVLWSLELKRVVDVKKLCVLIILNVIVNPLEAKCIQCFKAFFE